MNFNFKLKPQHRLKKRFGKHFLLMSFSALSIALLNESSQANTRMLNTFISDHGTLLHKNKFDTIVKGKITDEKGETLVGVSLKIKGTTIVATTDANGAFSITVPSSITNPVLIVSYIGYTTQEVVVDGKTTISVQLKSSTNDLDEVVVVGYNTVKKRDLTGAVSSVSAADIRSRPVTNALQAIQGKASGVDITSNERPGEIGRIRIRGNRSINASNDPLYVVDGIPLSVGGIETINPNDIETIDILKDASATAIYGSRGANGVVMVTTKKGKVGNISLDYVGTATVDQLNDRIQMMNSGEYIEFRRNAYRRNNGYPATPTLADDLRIFAGDSYVADNIRLGWQNGTFDGSLVPTTNWTDLVTRTGITQDHILSVSGGTDKLKGYASFGYLNQKGTQLGQDYTRYSTKLSVDASPTKWFKMGINLTASYGLQNFGFSSSSPSGAGSLYYAAQGMLPVAVPFDVNGNRINLPGGDINILNPVGEDQYNVNLRKTFRVLGSLYAEVNLLKGLKYRINFGPDFSNLYNGRYQDAKSINRGAGESGSTNYAQLNQNNRFAYTLDHLIYYDNTIGKHNFGVTLLQSSTSNQTESSSMTGSKIPLDNPLWYGLGSANISALDGYSTDLVKNRLVSYMGRINYTFNNKYLLTASIRWDGASQLSPGNKWDIFPSAALAWRLDQEDFVKNIKWINQLKLRFGLGSVGNSAVDPQSNLGRLQPQYYTYGSSVQIGYVPSDPSSADPTLKPNPLLGWEHTLQYNLGVDFDLFKGRIGGSLELYTSKTTDLLLLRSISSINGYNRVYENIGVTKNKGIDLNINTVNITNKDFSWNSTLTFSASKDKIAQLVNGDIIASNLLVGQRIGIYYDFVKNGIWQNTPEDQAELAKFNANIPNVGSQFKPGNVKVKDLNGDYKIDANNDRQVVGQVSPTITGGLSNTFNYKNFELSIFMLGRFNFTVLGGGDALQGRFAQRVVDYWTPTNPTNAYPAPNYGSAAGDTYKSALNYQDGSFIKIRNITLGYNFSQNLVKKVNLSKVRVYAQAINPGLIYSKVDFIDPDTGTSIFNRSFVLGVNVTF